ncbi:MAG: FAD-dependent oxidoreductase [Pseudomonadota bacterium]
MNQLHPSPARDPATYAAPDVIVIGGGPVGMRVGQLLAASGERVTLFSDEPYAPYNRVRLTPLLGGDVQFGDIALTPPAETDRHLDIRVGERVTQIDRDRRVIVMADGTQSPYQTLVIATGSRAFIPQIPGADTPGVYAFRTAEDASALLARSFSARHTVIVGGGLLGLEAARGLLRRGCQVTVVEHENRLMPRQLDKEAAAHLRKKIEALGATIHTGTRITEICGDHRVDAVKLGDGTVIASDTVVICTGVRANVDLAREAALAFDRGILVNAQMQTRDPNIYAVGECAQFEGEVVGLVGPGYAQAEVAAAAISGEAATYLPAVTATKLKVLGADVFSVGPVEQLEVMRNVKSHVWQSDDAYRRIFVDRGKLMGVIAVGEWDQASKMQEATQNGATVYPWMLYQFRRRGSFWGDAEVDVADLPDAATICNCTGVNCGQIRTAIAKGADDQTAISERTGAGTVCGTCKPLLDEMVDAGAPPKPIAFSRPLLGLSGLAVALALIPVLFGYVPMPTSYDAQSLRTWAWRDNIVKQWSGYILLGIICAAMVIGLRKRIRFFDRLGGYDGWRLVHIGIGVAAIAGFFAHTGFRLGANWNFLLGLAFLLTLFMGAFAGLATGGDHSLRAQGIGTARKPARRIPTWLHILAIWPLPVLILFHVLTIYAY